MGGITKAGSHLFNTLSMDFVNTVIHDDEAPLPSSWHWLGSELTRKGTGLHTT